MIHCFCPHCSDPMIVPDDYAGRQGRCLACKGVLTYPHPHAHSTTTDYAPPGAREEPFRPNSGRGEHNARKREASNPGCFWAYVALLVVLLLGASLFVVITIADEGRQERQRQHRRQPLD